MGLQVGTGAVSSRFRMHIAVFICQLLLRGILAVYSQGICSRLSYSVNKIISRSYAQGADCAQEYQACSIVFLSELNTTDKAIYYITPCFIVCSPPSLCKP